MGRIFEIGRSFGVPVVEDAAQAFGAIHSGVCEGCDGRCDDELAAHARRFRNHGSRPEDKYVHDLLQRNSRRLRCDRPEPATGDPIEKERQRPAERTHF